MTRRPNMRRREAPAPESRLLVLVATISIGIGVMAFVMGMRFGLGQNDREPTVADAGGALARLDRQAAQLRDLRQREPSTLSFHENLTGPAKPVTTLKKDGKPLGTPAPAIAPAAAATKPKVDAKTEVKTEPKSEPKPEPKAEPALEPAAIPAPAAPIAAEASDAMPAPPIVSVPASAGRFSLQAGAFPDEGVAKALAARLTGKGYQVRIVSAQVEGKGTWYRVRVGSYGDRSAADADRGTLSGEGVFAIVVPEN